MTGDICGNLRTPTSCGGLRWCSGYLIALGWASFDVLRTGRDGEAYGGDGWHLLVLLGCGVSRCGVHCSFLWHGDAMFLLYINRGYVGIIWADFGGSCCLAVVTHVWVVVVSSMMTVSLPWLECMLSVRWEGLWLFFSIWFDGGLLVTGRL